MLRVLLKKQLAEVFKSYFYDAKKNRMRSKGAIVLYFIFFAVVMVGMLGGIFTMLSLSLCGSLAEIGMDWLYFLLMGGISILLGAFGSVFNTYSGLYLAKDNDLLLSMPIPVRIIMTARLANVYLMGAMYSAAVLLPALIVYWIVAGATAARVICGLLLLLIVTIIVLLLSCLLGWVVAKISLRLKNKSFVTVFVSLLFIGGYYFFYFKASDFIRELIANAEIYGEKIRGAASVLYYFGRIGEGNWPAALIFLAVTAVLSALVWIVLSRTFLSIATASGKTRKARYTEKTVRQKSVFGAFLGKEFARFVSSPNYMLNCGLGILLIPAFGVLLLFKGREICEVLNSVFTARPDTAALLVLTALLMISALISIAVPSVSLEGRSIWIPQSLPVKPRTVLRAKAAVQVLLSGIPMLFAGICAAAVVPASWALKLLLVILPPLYAVFSGMYGMVIGTKMPLLSWTNEVVPIKQGGAVVIVLFSSWAISILPGGLYLLIGYRIGAVLYLLVWAVLFAAASLLLLRWLDRAGSRIFAGLS